MYNKASPPCGGTLVLQPRLTCRLPNTSAVVLAAMPGVLGILGLRARDHLAPLHRSSDAMFMQLNSQQYRSFRLGQVMLQSLLQPAGKSFPRFSAGICQSHAPVLVCVPTEGSRPRIMVLSRLVLVDALALLYRAHFGFAKERLSSREGEDTSIAFGFVRALLELLELDPPPTHFVVVFDACGKNFRCDDGSLLRSFRCGSPCRWASCS